MTETTLTLPDGVTATPLEAAIGASNEEVNPQTGKPYVQGPEARAAHSAAAKRTWAKRQAANRAKPLQEPPDEAELADAGPLPRTPDRPPGGRRRSRAKAASTEAPAGEVKVPAFRAGPIAKGMNSLYVRTGKLVRIMDADIGGAMIAMTQKLSDDDVTVGEAWEELARTNPRVRAFLLRLIEGGAWGQLFMAHTPLIMAVVMKDAIRRRIPLMRLLGEVMTDDDEGPAPFPTGLTQPDLEQMVAMAASQFGPVLYGVAPQPPRPGAVSRETEAGE